jgi:hypothetical protein
MAQCFVTAASSHCPYTNPLRTRDYSSVAQLPEIFVVQTEKVSNLVDSRRLDFSRDLFLAFALFFDRTLKNPDAIRVQRSVEAALGERRAFIDRRVYRRT